MGGTFLQPPYGCAVQDFVEDFLDGGSKPPSYDKMGLQKFLPHTGLRAFLYPRFPPLTFLEPLTTVLDFAAAV